MILQNYSILIGITFSAWTTPQYQASYSLSLDETLELKTTTNLVQSPITVYFVFPPDSIYSFYFINFKCIDLYSNTWIAVIRGCMRDSWSSAITLNSVPTDSTKVWQITRTSTSLVVVCNGVTVLNFNFWRDYRDGYNRCHELWTRESNTIQFNWSGGLYGDTRHLYMRISREGKITNSN